VGAVDRVDHPYGSRIRIARASLLPNKTVARKQPREAGDDQIFADAIGLAARQEILSMPLLFSRA